MANEVVSTTTTLAGLQERIQAASIAEFYTRSRLFDVVYTKNANGAGVVQFASPLAPSGITVTAQTEANANSDSAMSLAAKTATLAAYPYQTRVSKLAINGGQLVGEELAAQMSQYIVNAVDTAICGQFADFNQTVSGYGAAGAVNYLTFTTAHAALMNNGWMGTPVVVLGQTQWKSLKGDVATKYIPAINNEFGMRGEVYMLDGVEVHVVPDFLLASGGTVGKKGAIFFKELGIGLGYHDPMIQVAFTACDTSSVYLGAWAEIAATEIAPTGGVIIEGI